MVHKYSFYFQINTHNIYKIKKRRIKHPYRETFCERFFIASFPKKGGKVIESSQTFPARC